MIESQTLGEYLAKLDEASSTVNGLSGALIAIAEGSKTLAAVISSPEGAGPCRYRWRKH